MNFFKRKSISTEPLLSDDISIISTDVPILGTSTETISTISYQATEDSCEKTAVVTRAWNCLRYLLEPIVFLAGVAVNLPATAYQNQVLYQTCTTIYGYNETTCDPLLGIDDTTEASKGIESIVQPYAAYILMIQSIVQSIVPACVSLFIGPWSDKFGRRPIILTTFAGYTINTIVLLIMIIVCTSNGMNPWFFLLSSIPIILCGGIFVQITGYYSYVSDLATEHRTRARRMILIEAAFGGGIALGRVIGGYIYAASNAIVVFSISSGIMIVLCAYVFAVLEESLKPENRQTGSKVREFFRYDLVKELISTCFQRRPNMEHLIIWGTMAVLIIANFAFTGEENLFYLYVRQKFQWTVEEYSTYTGVSMAAETIGCITGIMLMLKVFKFSNYTIAFMAVICSLAETLVRALAIDSWQIYLGVGLGVMRGLISPMLHSVLSVLSGQNEIAKIFSFTNAVQYVVALGASPLYTCVYDATISFNPGIYNFISVGLYSICFVLIAGIFKIRRNHQSRAECT